MQVTMIAMGQLEKELGGKRFYLDFTTGATLADFLRKFGTDFASRIPEVLWNRAENRFRGPVVLMSNGIALRNPAEPLMDGQEIRIFNVLTGG